MTVAQADTLRAVILAQLEARDFAGVDKQLREVRLDVDHLAGMALLAATLEHRQHLPSRAGLYERMEKRLQALGVGPRGRELALAGLR